MTGLFTSPPMFASLGWLIVSLLVHAVVIGIPVLLLTACAFYLLSLPARRQERARLFLHLVEARLRDGQPIEPALISLAESHDRTLGLKFHLLAAHLEEGDRLGPALEKSSLLPRPLAGMFAAGLELGDLRKVIPACRMHLQDTVSGLHGALNYFFVLMVGMAPVIVFLSWFTLIVVAPKMEEVFYGVSDGGLDRFWMDLMQISLRAAVWVQSGMLGFLLLAAVLYLSGPGLPRWMQCVTHPFADWFAWLVPWKRKRMQRNFAALLAVLLDHRVPESVAVKLAAEGAGNGIFTLRARRVAARLAAGEPLTQAVTALDHAGEFRWRLTNAAAGRGGFTNALRGWFESLDARAFQQEQAAAHLITTALVVINGACVGCICAGLFGSLISIIESAALW
jgi:type II secretory pathway component PulF